MKKTDQTKTDAKQVVTVRVDSAYKAWLELYAQRSGTTISSTINNAVQQFVSKEKQALHLPKGLLVKHSLMPHTNILWAFAHLGGYEYEQSIKTLGIGSIEFYDDYHEWDAVQQDLTLGQAHMAESVSWLKVFWHIKDGKKVDNVDWLAPFTGIAAGHFVFITLERLENHLGPDEFTAFLAFRDQAKTGEDLSLRSLVAWMMIDETRAQNRALAIYELWLHSIAGCQFGADSHIAILRTSAVLAQLANTRDIQHPVLQGYTALTKSYQDFRADDINVFSGDILQSVALLSDQNSTGILLAGPADLRIQSLSTLATEKGFLSGDNNRTSNEHLGQLWQDAIAWLHQNMLSEDSTLLRRFLHMRFPWFLESQEPGNSARASTLDRFSVFQSLIQTWFRWFSTPKDAQQFLDSTAQHSIVEHYEHLSELLHPSLRMTSPVEDERNGFTAWHFPKLVELNQLPLFGTATLDIGQEGWAPLYEEHDIRMTIKDNGNTPGPVIAQMQHGSASMDHFMGGLVGGAEQTLATSGKIIPWNLDKIPNWKHIWDWAKNLEHISLGGEVYGLPLVTNADAMVYLPDRLKLIEGYEFGLVDSYSAVYDPRLTGKTAMEDSWVNSVLYTAAYLQFHKIVTIQDSSNLTINELHQVMDFLNEKKKSGQFFGLWNGWENGVSIMERGDVYVMTGWQPIMKELILRGINAKYAEPIEGYKGWSVNLLHASSKSRQVYEDCHKVANWLFSGYYGYEQATHRGYLVPCETTLDYAKYVKDLGVISETQTVNRKILNNTFWVNVMPDNHELYTKLWAEFREGLV